MTDRTDFSMHDCWDEAPRKEYPQREIFAYGRYIQCQILNWDTGEPPKYLICNPLHPNYREEFFAMQGMGTWMRVELREVLRALDIPSQDLLRKVVDLTYGYANENESVPSTKICDRLIERARTHIKLRALSVESRRRVEAHDDQTFTPQRAQGVSQS